MRLFLGCSLFYSIFSSEIKFVDVSSQTSFSRTDELSEKKSEKSKAKPDKEVNPFDILYPNTPQASVRGCIRGFTNVFRCSLESKSLRSYPEFPNLSV